MLYEFRSDERESLAVMQKHFEACVEFYRAKGVEVLVELVGDRPCSGEIDEGRLQALFDRTAAAIKTHTGMEIAARPGSTDCNIPLSIGIPAICTGCITGGKAHTREEFVNIDSLLPGLKIAFEMVLHHFE